MDELTPRENPFRKEVDYATKIMGEMLARIDLLEEEVYQLQVATGELKPDGYLDVPMSTVLELIG